MKANKVPIDLLPVHTLHLQTRNWAAKTFHHWNAFHVGTLPQVPSDEDLRSWRDAAADIMEELKALGVSNAQRKVCNMVNSYYKFDYKKRKTFSTVYDVVDMITDPDFNKKNMNLIRDMLHMFQYGIFRSGYNGWAHECATRWMRKRNIEYANLTTGKKARAGKGFVYKLIVTRACNSLCERLQNMSQRLFGEYVIVRDRKIKKFGDEYVIEKYIFNHRFKGYLCKRKKTSDAELISNTGESEVTKLAELIEYAKSKGMTFEYFQNVMTKVIEQYNVDGK